MPSASTPGPATSPLVGERGVSADAPPDVPAWAVAIGAVLIVLFLGLSANAYFGGNLLAKLRALRPSREPVAVTGGIRAFYSQTDAVSVGAVGIGSRGQDRLLQAGDVLLLGESGRLVRLESDGVTELVADGATTVAVPNLGPWDPAAGQIAGQTAQFVDGRWVVEKPPLRGIFSLDGLHEEDVPGNFAVVPTPAAGRPRRQDDRDGVSLRLRATEPQLFVGLQTHGLTEVPEGATVTVWAMVRAREDTTIGLRLTDVVDAAGLMQESIGRWPAPKGWTRVTLSRRLTYTTAEDRFAVGLVNARAGDWLDVRDAGVYLGALP